MVMRLAILQFAPTVGAFQSNVARATSLLTSSLHRLQDLDLLILPELAFTGYNFPGVTEITPFLEPTANGPSTEWAKEWARRLKCQVVVGYPETATAKNGEASAKRYNAVVMVDRTGSVMANYRKHFLYYTDETWAEEGEAFWSGAVNVKRPDSTSTKEEDDTKEVKTAMGICMDINPYKFTAPWTTYEFANHVISSAASLVILSMAWLTTMSNEELLSKPASPDLATLSYWIERFKPLLEGDDSEKETVVVFGNRCGIEGEAKYAGTSCVAGFCGSDVKLWDIMGRGQEGVCVVDTKQDAEFRLISK